MSERERFQGDVSGTTHGDFSDWDNPEDEFDDQPESDWDDADDDDSYVPGPDDPDYDLSEAAGYAEWEPPERDALIPQWLLAGVIIVLILALLTPLLIRIS